MRTTIEIKNEHRAKLLELAARRKEKGFSTIIAEAIDAYLRLLCENQEKRKRALRARGALSSQETNQMRLETTTLRKSWR